VSQAIPITLLTGYLGSGKTTLLAHLLAHPELKDTAVLVNEFGEIALDHQLLVATGETVVLLDRGCLCCALRSDLAAQLDELYTRRMRGEVPKFARVVIETTGLADPAPILQTLATEPMLAALYRLDAVVTTVDGQLGDMELDRHFESVKQAAVADRIVITKTDLAEDTQLAKLEERLQDLNPGATILRSAQGEIDPREILDTQLYDEGRRAPALGRWLRTERYLPIAKDVLALGRPERHDHRVHSFAVIYEGPVSGTRLWQGLEELIDRRGEHLLRIKGIVNVIGQAQPRVIHIVQHVLYPVTTLAAWPDADRRTRLVFIVRDLDEDEVRATLARHLAPES